MASSRTRERPDNIGTDTAISKERTNLHEVGAATLSNTILSNATGATITGGLFGNYTTISGNVNTVNNTTTVSGGPLGILHSRVAPNAILNAWGRADKVRCHPGTRETVMERIEVWKTEGADGRAPPIFWLSGPAGAGKSAIVQTIAESWKKNDVPQANFFFFRTDPSRNRHEPLIATLVHQIILLYPQVRDSVEALLSKNPLIFGSSIEEQVSELIIKPLRTLEKETSSYRPLVILIDGLDECDSSTKEIQQTILHAFNNVLQDNRGLICLLVAGRDESQIQATFNEISVSSFSLYLDDQFSPEDDIRLFVNYELRRVKDTHPLRHKLGKIWPPIADVDDIVTKSSGQFVYAAVVVRFIAGSSDSPILSLQRLRDEVAGAKSDSPYSTLDVLYEFILSQVKDQEALQDILHTHLLMTHDVLSSGDGLEPPLMPLLSIYKPRYTEAVVSSCLANLTPLAQYSNDSRLLFHHASFPDYLFDRSRSGNRFFDLPAFRVKILPAMWKCLNTFTQDAVDMADMAVENLTSAREMPPDFLKTLLGLKVANICQVFDDGPSLAIGLDRLRTLCTKDSELMDYAQLVRQWFNAFKEYVQLWQRRRHASITSIMIEGLDRHYRMITIERDRTFLFPPNSDITDPLSPRSDIERREIALWLSNLLHRIHQEIYGYPEYHQDYKSLLKAWITYGLTVNIPLDALDLDDLPGAQRYLTMARIERDIKWQPTPSELIPLTPVSKPDAREVAEWLIGLLHSIHRETFGDSDNHQQYKTLMKRWMSYAIAAKIPVSSYGLPHARRYLWECKLKHWVAYLRIGTGR